LRDLFGREVPARKIPEYDVVKRILADALPTKVTARGLVRYLYSMHEAVVAFYRLCKGEKAGHKISMLFNPYRYATRVGGSKSCSIVEAFNTRERFTGGIARAMLVAMGTGHPDTNLLYHAFQLGVNGVGYAHEFPPYIARVHFISFNANTVLDPCAGWGGRMIGAASLGIHYVGCEPATETYKGLLRLGEWLKQFDTGFDFRIINKPFEDVEESELGEFDLAYTSPPYYDTELYSDEETNSCNRFTTFEKWVEGFYLPMIRKALKLCRQGFVLNVGTRQYDLVASLDEFRYREIPSRLSGKGGLGEET
jgi:hypothetical protein